MRYLRVVSLIAGVALVAIALAGLIARRTQVGDDRDRRLEATAELVAARLDETIARVIAALTVASADAHVGVIAEALANPVCSVTDEAWSCSTVGASGPDALGVAEALEASARRGMPVVVVGVPADGSAPAIVVAVDDGSRRLYVPLILDTSASPGDDEASALVPLDGEPLFRARTVEGRRSVAVPSMVEFEDGPWAVRVTAPAAVPLGGDERWLFGIQVAIGSVLAVLALGGILAEQRTLHRRATTDALTKLPNRVEFERRATELLARLGREAPLAERPSRPRRASSSVARRSNSTRLGSFVSTSVVARRAACAARPGCRRAQ